MTQATLPNPRTWATDDLVTVPRLRADAVNAVAFLAQRPYFVAQCSLGPSWATTTDTPLPMDAELTDYWNGHLAPPASDTSTYWAPVPGWYLCDVRVPFDYTGGTAVPVMAGFQGLVNGSAMTPVHGAVTVNGSGSGTVMARAVDLIEQVVSGGAGGSGDYIQPLARQDSGSAVNLSTTAGALPTASVRWVCAVSGTEPLAAPPLAAVPNPITSAWLNANVRDTVRFLCYPPAAKAYYTPGSSSCANSSLSSPQAVPLTTVAVDTYGGLTTGSGALYTAPVAGRYLVAGQVNFVQSSSAATYACGITAAGTTYWGGAVHFSGTSLAGGASVTKRVRLTAGQTVQLVAAQSSGGSLAYSRTTNNQTRLIVVWEGS
jgi:hypothetical protein